MARYLLFSGDEYYPRGGMNDLVKGFDNKSDLMKFLIEKPSEYRNDWWHVADAVKCEIMFNDYEFDAEHILITCGDCGDILKIVPKDNKEELWEGTVLCEDCQAFKDKYRGVGN